MPQRWVMENHNEVSTLTFTRSVGTGDRRDALGSQKPSSAETQIDPRSVHRSKDSGQQRQPVSAAGLCFGAPLL